MKNLLNNPPAYIAFIAVVPCSTTVIWVRLSDAPSLTVALWRMIFSTILCIPFLIIERREVKNLSPKNFLTCALSGFFLALHFATWLSALTMTSAAAAASLVSTNPIFVALITAFWFHKKPSKTVIISLIFTIIGSVVVAFGSGFASLGSLSGNMLAVLGALTVAFYLVIGSFVRKTVTSGIYVTIVFAFAAIFLALFCIILDAQLAPDNSQTFLAIFALAVFCSLGGHVVFNWLLKYHEPMLISIAVLFEPVFASIWALWLFEEVPSVLTVFGCIMIIGGVWYYIKSNERPS